MRIICRFWLGKVNNVVFVCHRPPLLERVDGWLDHAKQA
jgi:hypothetical protein